VGSNTVQSPLHRLLDASASSPAALDELFGLVYGELRTRARAHRRRWQGDETLNTTALIHETYLKLAGGRNPDWESRAHFLAIASRAMRQVLVDYSRAKRAAKRGGDREQTTFDELVLEPSSEATYDGSEALVALDESLVRLQADNPRHAKIVECRFFGGMTIQETAAGLGLSPATVKRGWAIAQAWLYRDLQRSAGR
jgi:RNA polymerase sigma factor (TIGR02999 family)